MRPISSLKPVSFINLCLQVPTFLSGKTISINKNKTPINGDIKASEVMLIDQDGVKQN